MNHYRYGGSECEHFKIKKIGSMIGQAVVGANRLAAVINVFGSSFRVSTGHG